MLATVDDLPADVPAAPVQHAGTRAAGAACGADLTHEYMHPWFWGEVDCPGCLDAGAKPHVRFRDLPRWFWPDALTGLVWWILTAGWRHKLGDYRPQRINPKLAPWLRIVAISAGLFVTTVVVDRTLGQAAVLRTLGAVLVVAAVACTVSSGRRWERWTGAAAALAGLFLAMFPGAALNL